MFSLALFRPLRTLCLLESPHRSRLIRHLIGASSFPRSPTILSSPFLHRRIVLPAQRYLSSPTICLSLSISTKYVFSFLICLRAINQISQTPTAANFGYVAPPFCPQPMMFNSGVGSYHLGLPDMSPEYAAFHMGISPLQQAMLSPSPAYPLQPPVDPRFLAQYLELCNMGVPAAPFGFANVSSGPEDQVSLSLPSSIAEGVQEACSVTPSQLQTK